MRQLHRVMCNDLFGLNFEEDPDLEGFKLKSPESPWTLYTCYVTDRGFSAYVAIADIWKGVDCDNEIPLAEHVSVFACVNAIRKHHATQSPQHYQQIRELYEGAAEELCGFWN